MIDFGNWQNGQIKGIGKIGKTNEHSIENGYPVIRLSHNFLSVSQFVIKETR